MATKIEEIETIWEQSSCSLEFKDKLNQLFKQVQKELTIGDSIRQLIEQSNSVCELLKGKVFRVQDVNYHSATNSIKDCVDLLEIVRVDIMTGGVMLVIGKSLDESVEGRMIIEFNAHLTDFAKLVEGRIRDKNK